MTRVAPRLALLDGLCSRGTRYKNGNASVNNGTNTVTQPDEIIVDVATTPKAKPILPEAWWAAFADYKRKHPELKSDKAVAEHIGKHRNVFLRIRQNKASWVVIVSVSEGLGIPVPLIIAGDGPVARLEHLRRSDPAAYGRAVDRILAILDDVTPPPAPAAPVIIPPPPRRPPARRTGRIRN